MTRHRAGVLAALALVLVGGAVAGLACGAVAVPPGQVLVVLLRGAGAAVDPVHGHVVLGLRAPRVALGALVGASLGLAGALVQGWFRNPLAEPGLVGVTGGATLGAVAAIVAGGGALVPVAAALGGVGAVAVVHAVGSLRDGVVGLLLAGLALQATSSAGVGLLVTVADDDALRDLSFWTLGSLGGASWEVVAQVALPLALAGLAAVSLVRPLDALLLGEATATHLGVSLAAVRRLVAVLVAVLVGVPVATCGPIAFVGLLAPHVARLLLGPRHGGVLPAAALAGAGLLVVADVVARTVVAPVELPIGVLTTLLGGPLFLTLLLRHRGVTA